MAIREFQLMAVGHQLVEGIAVRQSTVDESVTLSAFVPSGEADQITRLTQHLTQEFETAGWENLPVALVLPSSEITLRKLAFPFQDSKMIGQALIYELENELLEDVNSFEIDYAILPLSDGTAEVLIYLLPKEYLHGIIGACNNKNLIPISATCSAQAIYGSHPAASDNHYYIYVGPDEVFVAFVAEGNLSALHSVPIDIAEWNEALGEYGYETPNKMIEALLNGEGGKDKQGEALRKKFRELLSDWIGEFHRFILPHSMGSKYTLSLHGQFSSYFQWEEQSNSLSLREGYSREGVTKTGGFQGVLREIVGSVDHLTGGGKVNFHQGGVGWFAQFQEHKRPLITSAVLFAVATTLFITSWGIGVSALNSRLEQIDAEILASARPFAGGEKDPVKAVRTMESMARTQQKGGEFTKRFQTYHYDSLLILQGISNVMKDFPQMSMESFSLNSERVTLSGITDSYNASDSLKNKLSTLDVLSGGEATVTHQRTGGEIKFRMIFPR